MDSVQTSYSQVAGLYEKMTEDVKTIDGVIQVALREGPKTVKELMAIVAGFRKSRQTLHNRLTKLTEEGIVEYGIPRKCPGARSQITYQLARNFRVKYGIDEFRQFMQRDPDPVELARQVGEITPQDAEKTAYETNLETHWHNPTEEEKQRGDSLVMIALISAAKIKQNQDREWIQNIPPKEREVAEHFIQKYPDILPIVVGDRVVGWPPKAKEFLRRYFDESRLEDAIDQG